MKHFFKELYIRFCSPWRYTAFVAYFIFIVVGFGGIGVYISMYNVWKFHGSNLPYEVATNLATYFMAIMASCFVDLNLSLNIKHVASTLIISFGFFAICAVLAMVTFGYQNSMAFWPAIIGTVLALFTWILANADNEKLRDETFYKRMRGTEHGNNWEGSN
jgi:hypothetical protein